MAVKTSTERAGRAHARRYLATLAANARADKPPEQLPDDVQEIVRRLHDEPRFFIESLLSVVPIEGGAPVPFLLNRAQDIVVSAVERQLAEGRPVRLIVLKSRRQGISTLGQGLGYWKTSTQAFQNGLVIAHKRDVSTELFRTGQRFYEFDKRRQFGLLPAIKASNEAALRFGNADKNTRGVDPGLDSALVVATAEGGGVAGFTLQFLHASETSKWTNPAIMAGLGIALSKTPGSIGLMESTAEGYDAIFKPTWDAATKGRNEWEPIFLPWSIDPKCQIAVTEGERRSWDFESKDERDLFERNGLSLEQIKWRRMQIASPDMIRPGVRPEDVFRQEFPLTPDEAFLSSGSHFFLPEGLARLEASEKGPREPVRRVEIVSPLTTRERGPRDWAPLKPILSDSKHGTVAIWEQPVAGEDYCIGGDVAEGLSHGDASVAYVLRRSNQRFVAKIKSQGLEADEFGEKVALLGWLYNGALVGVEINGPGILANKTIRNLHYVRIWRDRDTLRLDSPTKQHLGWRTTPGNRRPMLDQLEMGVRLGEFDMPDAEFYVQCRDFQLVDVGEHARPQAIDGRHDDDVMAAAITWQLHLRGGALRLEKRKEADFVLDYAAPRPAPMKKKRKASAYGWF